MANLGFTYYNTKPTPSIPTLQELISGLSGAQKLTILNGFVNKVLPKTLAYNEAGLNRGVVIRLYRAIDEIEEYARTLMRGELEITPAEIDPETNEIITPAVMNTPPTNATTLLSDVQDEFSEVFTNAQVSAILTKMVEYSKYDGSGDWAFYSSEVIK